MDLDRKIICYSLLYGVNIKEDLLFNKNRIRILKLLRNGEFKISKIRELLDLNYKTVYEHIKFLEKMSIIELKQNIKQPGKPVYVFLRDKKILDWSNKTSEEVDEEIKRIILQGGVKRY